MPAIDLPADYVGEITVLSTGGGYGECCVIHLGEKNWIIVDSCKNPKTKEVLPLEYLKSLNVNIEQDVKLIVCTHWHDDHIQGISELLDHAKSSNLCFAHTTDLKKFLLMVNMDNVKSNGDPTISSTTEFNKCIEIVKLRKSQIKYAHQDRILLTSGQSEKSFSVLSLSPSDKTTEDFDREISQLISDCSSNRKIVTNSPNDKCVVLYIKFNDIRVLLGADLEANSDPYKGWLNIINNCVSFDKKCSLFKISHHGSENGHHPRIWTDLLVKNPIAGLTPWNRNNKLPKTEMLKVFCSLSDNVYMTETDLNLKPKNRERTVEKLLKELNKNIREAKFEKGMMRFRINLEVQSPQWEVTLFENAVHVNSLSL